MQMYYNIDHRKTMLELEYEKRIVQFFSTDDLNSAKLRGRQNTIFYINEANSDLQSLMDEFGVKPNMGGIGNGYEYNGMVFDNPKGAILSAMFDELKELEGTGKYNVADSFFKRIQLLRKII